MKRYLKIIVVVTIVAALFLFAAYASPSYWGGADDDDSSDGYEDETFFEMLTRIINDIASLPSTIAQMVGTAISALMEAIAKEFLNGINTMIIVFFSSLENLLTDANLDLNHSVVKAIYNILRPTSTTFAALFLIIQITKSAATFEAIDITRVMKYLLFFVLAIFFIDNSLYVLDLIIKGFGGLTKRVLDLGYLSYISDSSSVRYAFSSIGDSIGTILLSMILSILVYFMALSLYITLAIRSVEILIMAAASGLFASTLASDATMDVFKSFIKTFIATVSSTLFMAIGFALFTSISEIQFITGDYAYVDTVIKMTAILAYCSKTPQTIRSILGYGSPTVNALSVVKSLMFH